VLFILYNAAMIPVHAKPKVVAFLFLFSDK
jgi:hypothetical protein